MINGNIDEFVEKLLDGEEDIYVYHGKKYFSQGYNLDGGTYYFEIQQWKPTASVLWSVKGLDRPASLDAFLKEPLFNGKTFWECEKEMEWVDE